MAPVVKPGELESGGNEPINRKIALDDEQAFALVLFTGPEAGLAFQPLGEELGAQATGEFGKFDRELTGGVLDFWEVRKNLSDQFVDGFIADQSKFSLGD
jgi:hypothetical protein